MNVLRRREEKANKGSYGKTIIIGGSISYPGSVLLASLGASKSGVGYVALGIEKNIYPIVAGKIFETIYEVFPSFAHRKTLNKVINRYDSIVFGNGIENNKKTQKALRYILVNYDKKILIDATGLDILKNIGLDELNKSKAQIVITPHLKEFSRLFDVDINKKRAVDLSSEVKKLARKYNITIVLKDYNSVVTDGKSYYVVTSGNAGLAHAGSGDALSGFIGGLLAHSSSPIVDIAFYGHDIFSLSAEYASKNVSEHSLTPTDVCNAIGTVLKKEKL